MTVWDKHHERFDLAKSTTRSVIVGIDFKSAKDRI